MANPTGNMTNLLDNGAETKGPLWQKVTMTFTVFTVIIVALRVGWRRKLTGKTTLSDILIMLSFLLICVQEIVGYIAIQVWGLGHHSKYIGVHKTHKALMYFYIYQIFYKISAGTTKLAFTYLYLELFPVNSFRLKCHVLNASILAGIVAFVAGTVFQCTPIPFFWNKTIPGGTCIGAAPFWYTHAAWNTVTDILVLVLPIRLIWSLQMRLAKKLAIGGVFGIGSFVILASIVRMVSLNPASKVTDPTYVISVSDAFLWTQVESCAGVVCSCLPTIWGVVGKLFPKFFGSSKGSYVPEEHEINARGSSTVLEGSNLDAEVLSVDGTLPSENSFV